MKKQHKQALFLRLGLALPFLYAGIASVIVPHNWIGYLPAEASRFGSPEAMLFLFSLFQIALALWLFSGRGLRAASLLSAVALLAIILPNLGVMDLIFRDIGLFFAALALFSLSK